jgi:uncharacterized protein
MRRLPRVAFLAALAFASGCVSVDREAAEARAAIASGRPADATAWSCELATNSFYSTRLGRVEAGRVAWLSGDFPAAEAWFRAAVDGAIDRQEGEPRLKLGDVGNAALSATVTDDRTREYYLSPYEINLALAYVILAQLANGKIEDARADARLAVYVQDTLAKTYGEDLAKSAAGGDADEKRRSASSAVVAQQTEALDAMMAATRNSWENPVLWWLTGAVLESSGETDMAEASYRKASACRPENAVFRADVERLEKGGAPAAASAGTARVVLVYEEGLVPQRQSLKIPVPIYTAMSIDVPTYAEKTAWLPRRVAVSGAEKLVAATPALDVRALAARDLSEQMPGIVVRNITRAAVQAGAQTAVNAAGNDYAKLAVLIVNAIATAIRRADTRSWVTLPDGMQVWEDGAMKPGSCQLGVEVDGRTVAVPLTLAAGDVKLVWIADVGPNFQSAVVSLK